MVSKKTTTTNTLALQTACERLGIPYQVYDIHGNFIGVKTDRIHYFANCSTPFNDGGTERVCRDKGFSYELLKDTVRMPRTKAYVDPNPINKEFDKYVDNSEHNAITDDILKSFSFPIIIKMNSGSEGKNVYLCKTHKDVHTALTAIYSKQSTSYDYIALAQECVYREREYRVIVLQGKVILAYEKDFSNGVFVGNLSPLHYENAKAIHITDSVRIDSFQAFINPLQAILPLGFMGLDLLQDNEGQLWLIELNTQPAFNYFVRDNSDAVLIDMYATILKTL